MVKLPQLLSTLLLAAASARSALHPAAPAGKKTSGTMPELQDRVIRMLLDENERLNEQMKAATPVTLHSTVPDFAITNSADVGAETFYDFLDKDRGTHPWTLLLSHPKDFTPVCTTELSRAHKLKPEFDKRGVKMIGISCDSAESHAEWTRDVLANAGDNKACTAKTAKLSFPIIADEGREIVARLGMLDPALKDAVGVLPARALHVIGENNEIKLSMLYPASVGRSFTEILRAIDALQLTAQHEVATPVDFRCYKSL
jgi:peroxiredoxin 6